MKCNSQMRKIVVIAIVLCLALYGCSHKGSTGQKNGGVIDEEGTFSISDNLSLTIAVDAQGIVKAEVRNADGDLIVNDDLGSTYQRWFVAWDSKTRNFWSYSGDLGIWVWIPDETGKYVSHDLVSGQPLPAQMPIEFWDNMSSGIQASIPRPTQDQVD